MNKTIAIFCGLLMAGSVVLAAELPPPADTKGLTFDKDIKPIFAASCTGCHGAEKQKAKVRLDTLDAALKSGKAVVPGKSAESKVVISAARQAPKEEENMPPKGKGKPLTAEQVGLIRAWIDQGAK